MSDPAGTAGAVQYYVNSSTFGGDSNILHIDTSDSNLTLARSAAASELTIKRTSTYTGTNSLGNIMFDYDVDTVAGIGASRDGADDAAALQLFTQATGGANTERMRITSAGEVGIGTSSPSSGFKLDVDGKAIIRDDLNLYNDYAIQYWKKTNGTDNLGWILNRDDNSCQYVWADGQDLRFLTTTTGGSTTERVRIDSNGKMLFGGSTQSLSWPATTAESTSRAWAFIGEQGAYGKFELRRSASATTSATDGTSISTMAFDRSGNVGMAGNVGIGTTSPTSPASVARILEIEDAQHAGIVLHDSTVEAWEIFANAGDLKFRYNNVPGSQTTLKSDGKVGIGTDDLSASGANAKLGVSSGFINVDDTYGLCWGGGTGRPNISGSKSAGTITIDNVSVGVGIGGTPAAERLEIINSGTDTAPALRITNDAQSWNLATRGDLSDSFVIRDVTGGVNALTIAKSTGNVGIGTTSPDSTVNLHISDANPKLRLEDGDETNVYTEIFNSSGDTQIRSRDGSSNGIFSLMGNNGTTDQYFLRIDASGDVGIGTAAPIAKLDVDLDQTSGDLTAASSVHFGGQHHTTGEIMGITLGYREASADYRKIGLVAAGLGDAAARQDFHILVDSVSASGNVGLSDSKFMIAGLTGYIGIGTNSPSHKLEIAGSENTLLNINGSGTNTYLKITDSTSSGGNFIGATGDTLHFWTDNSERMRIDSSGLVGIGSSSPSSYYSNANDLVVARNDHAGITIKTGTAHTGWLVFADGTASGDNTRGGISYDHNNDRMAFRVNNDRKVAIDSNGTVTIGGNASAAQMSVTSTGSTANLAVQAGEGQAASVTLLGDDGDDSSDITILQQQNTGPFKIRVNNGGTTALCCDSGGNVGIKRDDASYALDVNGVVNCTSLRFADGTSISTTPTGTVLLRDLNPAAFNYDMHVAGKVGIGTTSPSTTLHIASISPVIKLEDTDAVGTPQCDISGAGGDLILRADKDGEKSDSLVSFEIDGSEKMRITSAGNVGIGSTDPATKLEVTTSSSSGVTPLCVSNRDTTAGTGQSASISFGLARNSGAFKDKAGKIQVGRELDWTSDDAKIDSFMSFSVYQNNAEDEKMRITSVGNVGIGTTSPSGRLELRQSSTVTPVLRLTDAGVANYDFVFPDTSNFKLKCNTTSTKNFLLTNEGTGNFNLVVFGGRMMLSGYSSNPLSKIHIRDAANLGTNFQAARNGDTAIRFDIPNYSNNIVVPMLEAAHSGNDGLPPAVRVAAQMTNNGSNLIFGTSNSYTGGVNNSALTIKFDSRIGLNQQAPAATLDIWKSPRHTGNDVRLRRADNQSTYCDWVYNSGTCQFGTVGSDHLSFFTNNTSRIYLHGSSGNVGINSSSPNYTLDVNGTIRCNTLIFKDGTSFSSVGAVGNKAIAVNVGGGSSNPEGRAKSVVDASYGGIQNGLVLVYYHYNYSSHCGNGGCTRTAYAKRAYQVVDGNWSYIFGF